MANVDTTEVPSRPLLAEPIGQDKWREAAITYDIEQLKNLRDSASKWSAAITALLGLFTTVAIISGTEKLADISSTVLKVAIIALIVVTGVVAGIAILLANMAAGAGSRTGSSISNFNADSFRGWVDDATRLSARYLERARKFGYAAVVGVFAVGTLGLVSAALPAGDAGSGSSVLVVYGPTGATMCGPLATTETGLKLGEQAMPGDVRQVIPVGKC